ncbi:tetratricopeptide (TPR) repeat protein [Mycobacterium frederiksbergense]|uniref:Tetratricopeptide repeat protein 38 n=1 Tax=Mycolicibacterium frederiksbergense TaxID=117567 RepID=A0ABT6L6T3_9MYCO|nr:tetratricopeptide repeat protein [Mycolicibacterium frederiksbergense]MDH6198603.1 tetratricopeptide (TPR) repeat protein [Mycolicibacterium frederiksbergense]
MRTDGFGAEVSYDDPGAIETFTEAARKLLGYEPDPVALLVGLLADHPDFVMARCLLAGAYLVASDARFQPLLAAEYEELTARQTAANDRERGHLLALRHWLDGDWYGASAAYAAILARHPRDLCALLFGHQVDFLLGQGARSQDRAAPVLDHWDPAERDSGFIHGILSFGLEECGHYARAEEAALQALELNPRDTWAIHGRAHCYEMQGQAESGIAFMSSRQHNWGVNNYLASHNAWHLALMHIERAEFDAALVLHDRYMRITADSVLMGMHDSCALLWRLAMDGVDVGDRWTAVGNRYVEVAEQAYMGFTDLHAAIAFVATENYAALDKLLVALRREAGGSTQRATIARLAALPIAEGLYAFGKGDHATATELFAAHRYSSHLFGGSVAQRDIITVTYLESAIRAGHVDVVQALLAERRLFKPESPLTEVIRSRLVAPATVSGTGR